MLEIKDLSIKSGYYFSEVFEKDILNNLKSVKLTLNNILVFNDILIFPNLSNQLKV